MSKNQRGGKEERDLIFKDKSMTTPVHRTATTIRIKKFQE